MQRRPSSPATPANKMKLCFFFVDIHGYPVLQSHVPGAVTLMVVYARQLLSLSGLRTVLQTGVIFVAELAGSSLLPLCYCCTALVAGSPSPRWALYHSLSGRPTLLRTSLTLKDCRLQPVHPRTTPVACRPKQTWLETAHIKSSLRKLQLNGYVLAEGGRRAA